MQVFTKVDALRSYLESARREGRSAGFVPTMGALHPGHGSLVSRARAENDIVVVSIFVNPTQFNNPLDLEKYPRTEEQDLDLLRSLGCDAVFLPSVEEIYPPGLRLPEIDLGFLDNVMEGKHRPGHFMGVVQVVHRLFDIVKPDRAYFGLKDFQQVAVIRFMVKAFGLPVQIVSCPTLREADGLAMSSRNQRLSADERQTAVYISRTLYQAKEWALTHTPAETKALALAYFADSPMELEYFEIVDPVTLVELTAEWVPGAVACIVAYAGDVRLIDNMQLAG